MIKSFFKDSLVYTVPSILSRGVSLLMVPFYTRVLDPKGYGVLDLLLVIVTIANLIVALEISQAVARFYSSETDVDSKRLYSSTSFWFSLVCYLLFSLFFLAASDYISMLIFNSEGYEYYFQLSMVYIFFNGMFYIIQNQLRWEFRSLAYGIASIIYTSVSALSGIFFVILGGMKLQGVLYGMILGALLGCLYGLFQLRDSYRFEFDVVRLRKMLLFSSPLVPVGIIVFSMLYIDRLMINHYMTLDDVGIYGMGFRLASVVSILMVGFQMSLTPLVYANYHKSEVPGQLATIFRVFVAFGLIFFIFVGLFIKEILVFIVTPAYYSASSVVVLLVPAIFFSNMYVFFPGIGIAKKNHLKIYIHLLGLIVSILLNYQLIPLFGVEGAAISALLGYLSVFIGYALVSQKLYPVPHDWARIILGIALAGMWVAFVWWGDPGVILKIAALFVSVLILFFAKLVCISDIKNLYIYVSARVE
ncbi:oligosaccharide flippase family protein [Aestuariirhabdus sp. Z084]|uniref:oligosaccharide flippase family protein n=1 Tax=Aestuariirhabdus haliotis TaxID=2918751 RepID=UPI0020BE9F85|nr:oligosaccharide flippase family protein [Aestuariirhabdus haliotis]MCL6415804.1 oligosaccharide flippase family protein [Aestuariirhabdus haliotis]